MEKVQTAMMAKIANLQKEESIDVAQIKKELSKMLKNKHNSLQGTASFNFERQKQDLWDFETT